MRGVEAQGAAGVLHLAGAGWRGRIGARDRGQAHPRRAAHGRGKIVESLFEVISHTLVGRIVDVGDGEALRKEHVMLHRGGEGKAVALLPSISFVRRGPRDDETKVKLYVKASWATLTNNGNEPPTWNFHVPSICFCESGEAEGEEEEEEVPCDCARVHRASIAWRILDIAARAPGSVKASMRQECLACATED